MYKHNQNVAVRTAFCHSGIGEEEYLCLYTLIEHVTQQTLNQGMTDLDETVKQGKQAHDEAAAAVNDPAKRVKVSE